MSYFHSSITHSMKNLMSYLILMSYIILMSYLTKCSMNMAKFETSNSNFTQFTNIFTDGKYFSQKLNYLKKKNLHKTNDAWCIISEKLFVSVASLLSSVIYFRNRSTMVLVFAWLYLKSKEIYIFFQFFFNVHGCRSSLQSFSIL